MINFDSASFSCAASATAFASSRAVSISPAANVLVVKNDINLCRPASGDCLRLTHFKRRGNRTVREVYRRSHLDFISVMLIKEFNEYWNAFRKHTNCIRRTLALYRRLPRNRGGSAP